jgi:hypothetical protein
LHKSAVFARCNGRGGGCTRDGVGFGVNLEFVAVDVGIVADVSVGSVIDVAIGISLSLMSPVSVIGGVCDTLFDTKEFNMK